MRLKSIITVFFLIISIGAQSQVLIGLLFGDKLNQGPIEFGLNGIVNVSNLTLDNGGTNRTKLGFGLYLDYNINKNFILASSFFFASPKGQKNFDNRDPLFDLPDSIFTGTTTERIINYFELPIMLEYRAFDRIGVGFGGYLAYANSARDQYYGEFQGGTLGYERSILGELNRLDYGIAAGLHYHFKGKPGSQIRVSYQLGFNPVFKDASIPEAYNENLQIAVLIPIKFGILSTDEVEEIQKVHEDYQKEHQK